MFSAQQKNEFSVRLQSALNKNPTPINGASELARFFNARKRTDVGISVQTAHKWLTGRAIPAYEKMRELAECLDVDLQWLGNGFISAGHAETPSILFPSHADNPRTVR